MSILTPPPSSNPNIGLLLPAEPGTDEEAGGCGAAPPTVAVTGATGFVGRALVDALLAQGLPLRALSRPESATALPQAVEAVQGSLADAGSLERLVEGAGTVVHAAGVVAARRDGDYRRVNTDGTARLVEAMQRTARPPRLLLVSSLAARHPDLSSYAASKSGAEAVVAAAGLEYRIVRPPAVYGPRDRATLEIFRQLLRGLLIVPNAPDARFSLIYVDDLAAAMAHLLGQPDWNGETVEPDDGREGGYGWADLAVLAGMFRKQRVRCVRVPRPLARCAALAEEAAALALGRLPRLSRGKLRELCYPDWVCRNDEPRVLAGWRPRVTFDKGFALTVSWYLRHGWL